MGKLQGSCPAGPSGWGPALAACSTTKGFVSLHPAPRHRGRVLWDVSYTLDPERDLLRVLHSYSGVTVSAQTLDQCMHGHIDLPAGAAHPWTCVQMHLPACSKPGKSCGSHLPGTALYRALST